MAEDILDTAKNWPEARLEMLEKEFYDLARNLKYQIEEGGGLCNLHIGKTLKDMHFLTLLISAHVDAIRTIDKSFSYGTKRQYKLAERVRGDNNVG